MRFLRSGRLSVLAAAVFLLAASMAGQDADKQKLIDIEKAFAAQPNPGPQAAAVSKQYLFEGTLVQLTGLGQVGELTKARVIDLMSKPSPSDPNEKSTTAYSDFQVQLYGETALVGYKMTNTDAGHKDAVLNATDHYGCLDTFVKRSGQWYVIANACAPSTPLPPAEWDAARKAMGEMPKDVKDAYH